MTDSYKDIISFLDRIGESYPSGIAVAALQRANDSIEAQHKPHCVMVISGESEKQRMAAIEFARNVCEKGLELRSDEYRIVCEDSAVEDLDSYAQQYGARLVVCYQSGSEEIHTQKVGQSVYLHAPSARRVAESANLKRTLWNALKCFRRAA